MTQVFSGDYTVTETVDDATGDRTITMEPLSSGEPPPPPPPPPPETPFDDEGDTVHPWVPPYTWPSAIYVPETGKTLMSWERWGAVPFAPTVNQYMAWIKEYDHATGIWSSSTLMGNHTLVDDTHGNPAICRDHQGFLWAFYGSHNSAQRWASSWAPDDIAGGGADNTWNVHGPMTGTFTYPKPVPFGTGIKLLMRQRESGGGTLPLVVRDIQTNNGQGTLGPKTTLVRLSQSRVYASEARLKAGEIWFMFTRADSLDTIHTGIYLARWNPATGEMLNHDGSYRTTVLPLDLSTADAHFRVVPTGTDRVEIPSWCWDAAGDLHFIYGRGNTSPLDMMHATISGGVVSTPIKLGEIAWKTGAGYVGAYSCVPAASGIEAWWPEDDVPHYTLRGGDRVVRSVAGVRETMLTASGPAVGHPTSVADGHADVRVLATEVSQSQAASTAGPLKRYGHGDGGFINF